MKARLYDFVIGTIIFLFLLFMIEFVSYFIIIKKYTFANMPDYKWYYESPKSSYKIPFWADVSPIWGVWHYGNKVTHKGEGIDAIYSKNSHGARDIERSLNSKKERVVFLGDSFTEGYAVKDGKRFSDLIEKRINKECLNFGTSGNFGPTQYYLLYENLASKFDHSTVVINILPHNDFDDDDLKMAQTRYKNRYRPYLVGIGSNLKIRYELNDILKSEAHPSNLKLSFKKQIGYTFRFKMLYFLNHYSYFFNAIEAYKARNIRNLPLSRYYRFTSGEFNKLKFSLQKIIKKAGKRKIIITTLPSIDDLKECQRFKYPTPLIDSLTNFVAHKENVKYHDLLPDFYKIDPAKWNDLYLRTDGHWTEQGHKIAADAILKKQKDL